jgi:hypothetical protein
MTNERIQDTTFRECTFDNWSAKDCELSRLRLEHCRFWACSLHGGILRDCVIDDLRMTIGSGGGRRTPLFLWGTLAEHVVLNGRIGGFIWNLPYETFAEYGKPKADRIETKAIARAREHYAGVDWALDISQAKFSSVPAFRYGPPGRLIRRDERTQPLVTREDAEGGRWRAIAEDIGVWRVVLDSFAKSRWPDEIVLTPAAGGTGERDRAGIERLREIGVAR